MMRVMNYRTYRPQPPLSDFVDLFWDCEGHAPPHARERLLPSGTMQLIINLREDRLRIYDADDTDRVQSFRGSLICGAHSEFYVIDTASQAAVIGIHFKPGGASPFLKFPAIELRNAHLSSDMVWGATVTSRLRDQLLEAGTPEARFRIIEQFLMSRAVRSLNGHWAVAFALSEFTNVPHTRTISDVAKRTGFSQRRFIELFSQEVGLTPKMFCRIQRFQRALRLANRGRRVEWADIASECGYFDQPHFIRDFHAFSGLNPSAYLKRRGEHLNHVPLPV
jgi:AraC-like DNA-binding protein